MDHTMPKEESYADRRQLFKNIWDTSLNIDKGEEEKKVGNVVHKPKVIKTARYEVNHTIAEKKKKQRLRNLKIVCNKILEFCHLQNADDSFYEQMASKTWQSSKRKKGRKSKKSKISKVKANSMYISSQDTLQTGIKSPDELLNLVKSSPKDKEKSLNTQDNYRKREKRKRVKTFSDAKVLVRACHQYPPKRLFPINTIYID